MLHFLMSSTKLFAPPMQALFGYKIMRVIGVKAAKLSNSRGFCCELSTAIVVMVASRYGLPVSTTQVGSKT